MLIAEIERHALLSAVPLEESDGDLVCRWIIGSPISDAKPTKVGRCRPAVVTHHGALNLEDVGTQTSENGRHARTSNVVTDVQYFDALKHDFPFAPLRLRVMTGTTQRHCFVTDSNSSAFAGAVDRRHPFGAVGDVTVEHLRGVVRRCMHGIDAIPPELMHELKAEVTN